jgi:hypothetical protein
MRVLLLRTARAVTQIQRLTHPDVAWTDWTDGHRLVEALANVLAELDYDLDNVGGYAGAALRDAREKHLLQFKDEDEWRPGMVSGTGWVEKVSLSLIGEKLAAEGQGVGRREPSEASLDVGSGRDGRNVMLRAAATQPGTLRADIQRNRLLRLALLSQRAQP